MREIQRERKRRHGVAAVFIYGIRYHSPVRSQAKAFNFSSVSGDNLRPSEYEILAVTFLVDRMPGITVLTASWLSVKRRASSARLFASSPSNNFRPSTR